MRARFEITWSYWSLPIALGVMDSMAGLQVLCFCFILDWNKEIEL